MEKLVAQLALHYFVMIINADTIQLILNSKVDLCNIDEQQGFNVEFVSLTINKQGLLIAEYKTHVE